jgi:BASS family bile acid:Na+ symporter
MKRLFSKSLIIPLAITAGIVFNDRLYILAPGLRYLLATMLLLTFSKLELRRETFRPLHLRLVLAQFAIGFLAYAALWPFNANLALAGFMIGVTPTATATPVITAMLGGEIGFATVAVMLSNVATALLVPPLLPWLTPPEILQVNGLSPWQVPAEVAAVVGLPLIAALALKRFWPTGRTALARLNPASYFIWAAVLAIVCAKSTHFLFTDQAGIPPAMLAGLVAISLTLCAINFTTGRYLGGKPLALEAGQALGQKNTALTIWMSLAFINPIVALGPTFYVLWHNGFNSWQLWRKHHREK